MTTSITQVGSGVISERGELHATGWHDCSQASAMRMFADAGGVFPLPDDLDTEREDLERAGPITSPEQGATMPELISQMNSRYGWAGKAVANLDTALTTPGTTVIVMGQNGNLPSGSFLRRWDPGFTGGHCVAVRVESVSGVVHQRWLDPEAPMGYTGDITDIATIKQWMGSWLYVRQAAAGELKSQGDPMISTQRGIVFDFRAVIAPGTNIRSEAALSATNVVRTTTALEKPFYLGAAGVWRAVVFETPDPNGGSPFMTTYYVHESLVTGYEAVPAPAPVMVIDQAAIDAAVAKATADLQQKVTDQAATISNLTEETAAARDAVTAAEQKATASAVDAQLAVDLRASFQKLIA